MSRAGSQLLGEEGADQAGSYGCPMLVRTRLLLGDPPHRVMRCHLGWALRTEEDVMRCLGTEDQNDCWQLHPERIPDVSQAPETSPEATEDG